MRTGVNYMGLPEEEWRSSVVREVEELRLLLEGSGDMAPNLEDNTGDPADEPAVFTSAATVSSVPATYSNDTSATEITQVPNIGGARVNGGIITLSSICTSTTHSQTYIVSLQGTIDWTDGNPILTGIGGATMRDTSTTPNLDDRAQSTLIQATLGAAYTGIVISQDVGGTGAGIQLQGKWDGNNITLRSTSLDASTLSVLSIQSAFSFLTINTTSS